jgi:hypothetical protein
MKNNQHEIKNYVYRVDHDTGFAPHVENGILSLCGCKFCKNNGTRNIEELANIGSWIMGIGGNNTGKPNKLIYIMNVEEKLAIDEFKKKYSHGNYIKQYMFDGRKYKPEYVLISRHKYYYFGNNAIDIPDELKYIIIDRQGYKIINETDVNKLLEHIRNLGYNEYGKYGEPNNNNKDEYPRNSCKPSCNCHDKTQC